ncbi:cytidyltransferase [Candidatus Bathyarchaeota archaeon ex4484_135]|nr:MAG: cytidyltransferase [Candidatus Bathyarchaeota archaeon ex4484_135]
MKPRRALGLVKRRGLARRALIELYLAGLDGRGLLLDELSSSLGLDEATCKALVAGLVEEGLVEHRGDVFVLGQKGRESIRVVMTGGVFDILHVGHLATLEAAKGLGDVLVVVVARDETVKRLKGREPLNREEDRLKLVSALKPVDKAILGDPEDFLKVVELIGPDVIALGYDQKHDEKELRRVLAERGLRADIVRLNIHVPGVKSSKILARLLREI